MAVHQLKERESREGNMQCSMQQNTKACLEHSQSNKVEADPIKQTTHFWVWCRGRSKKNFLEYKKVCLIDLAYLTVLSLMPYVYGNFARARLHTHKIASVTTWVAWRCTSWCHQPRPCVRTPDTKLSGIMCLLVGVLAEVQAPRWVACHQLVLGSFLWLLLV